MNEPTTVTYSIAEVLKRIEDKIDTNQKEIKQDIKDLNTKLEKQNTVIEDKIDTNQKEIKQDIKDLNTKLDKLNTVEVKLAAIETEVKSLNKDVTELKGSTKAQIWTLIGILVTAVSGFLVAVARFVFYPLS